MTYIVTLAHFCEMHGPSMIMCTQAVQKDEPASKFYSPPIPSSQLCQSCRLTIPYKEGMPEPSTIETLSKVTGSTYVTTQFPTSQKRYSSLRHIIMRVFTIENTSDINKPLIFGDTRSGYSMALLFKIADKTARGSERKYSLIVTSDSESDLFANYSLILINMAKTLEYITRSSVRVAEGTMKQNEDNNDMYMRRSSRQPKVKSLVEILDDEELFLKLHLVASTLLEELRQ